MSYLTEFKNVNYRFGNQTTVNSFPNLSLYSDIVDQLKDSITTYSYYNILDGDRADTLSFKLYGRPDYHWTFWLMNDHIRESGWPLDRPEIEVYLRDQFPGTTIVTRDIFWGDRIAGTNLTTPVLNVGDEITGLNSAIVARVTSLDPDNGQFSTDSTELFTNGEEVTYRNTEGTLHSLTVHSSSYEYLGACHYENSEGDQVDIDPTVGPGGTLLEVTIRDEYLRRNEELREIKVIRPDVIEDIVKSVQKSLAE